MSVATPPPLVDISGRPIREGDYVVYVPGNRHASLKFARVLTIEEKQHKMWERDRDPKVVPVAAIVKLFAGRKKGELDEYGGYQTEGLLLLSPEQVPAEQRERLDRAFDIRRAGL